MRRGSVQRAPPSQKPASPPHSPTKRSSLFFHRNHSSPHTPHSFHHASSSFASATTSTLANAAAAASRLSHISLHTPRATPRHGGTFIDRSSLRLHHSHRKSDDNLTETLIEAVQNADMTESLIGEAGRAGDPSFFATQKASLLNTARYDGTSKKSFFNETNSSKTEPVAPTPRESTPVHWKSLRRGNWEEDTGIRLVMPIIEAMEEFPTNVAVQRAGVAKLCGQCTKKTLEAEACKRAALDAGAVEALMSMLNDKRLKRDVDLLNDSVAILRAENTGIIWNCISSMRAHSSDIPLCCAGAMLMTALCSGDDKDAKRRKMTAWRSGALEVLTEVMSLWQQDASVQLEACRAISVICTDQGKEAVGRAVSLRYIKLIINALRQFGSQENKRGSIGEDIELHQLCCAALRQVVYLDKKWMQEAQRMGADPEWL